MQKGLPRSAGRFTPEVRTHRYDANLAPYTRKALHLIETKYDKNISLTSVADALGISASHLSATFKADMGCTFSDYLFQFRMQIARDLLISDQHKIYEIGEKVGYPDMAQFSKRFKQYYGISPRDMQKINNSAAKADDH